MKVQVEFANGCTVFRPVGSLDLCTSDQLREAMAFIPPASMLVVDLSAVPFIDSAALAALVAGIRRVREEGGDAAVCSTRPHVTRVLGMIGLDRVVPIAGSMEEAERVVTSGEHPARSVVDL